MRLPENRSGTGHRTVSLLMLFISLIDTDSIHLLEKSSCPCFQLQPLPLLLPVETWESVIEVRPVSLILYETAKFITWSRALFLQISDYRFQLPRPRLSDGALILNQTAMPTSLSENDKETVKRTVPKASNKINAVAVARLYIAYPNRQRWIYTGLQGAVVLTNDLVGNTFWMKLVDISVRPVLKTTHSP